MSETRSMVKSVLGFALAILVIVGGIFGLNVKVEVEDTAPISDECEDAVPYVEENADEQPTENVNDNTPTDTSPVDGETTDEDNSADTEVAEPTEDETPATEGENVENA